MSKTSNNDVNSLLTKLDEIVTWFEQDTFDIEEAVSKFEEGTAIAEEVKLKLSTLENKITVLKEKFDTE